MLKTVIQSKVSVKLNPNFFDDDVEQFTYEIVNTIVQMYKVSKNRCLPRHPGLGLFMSEIELPRERSESSYEHV